MKINLNGEVGIDIKANDIALALNECKGDIDISINSVGGGVFEGIEIYNLLKAYDKGAVNITINAVCASIATYIALSGDSIKVHDNSTFMIHNAWAIVVGDYKKMQHTSEILQSLSTIIAKAYASKTNKSLNEIKKAMDEESFYYGSEILQHGFCDKDKKEAYALIYPKIKAISVNEDEKLSQAIAAKLSTKKAQKKQMNLSKLRARQIKLLKESL